MAKVSIVILNWNSLGFLQKFLPILIAHTPDENADIVIADNGSTDGSADWISRKYPDLKLILLDRNYGYSGGYALALEQITTPFAILMNSDIEVPAGWLTGLLDFMESHPEAGAAAPKILSYVNRNEFEYAGAAGGWIDRYGFPFCRGRIFNAVEQDNGQFETPEKIFWASGACLMVRMDAYRDAGGLDPHFFAHMEEIDLCWRMQLKGYEIWYYPGAQVYHVGGGTLPNESPFKLFLNFRNNLLLLYKNVPANKRERILFIRMVFDGVAALQYLVKGKVSSFKAVLKAHKEFRQMRGTHYTGFIGPQSGSDTNLTGMHQGSIVIRFFLMGNRRFSQISRQR